MWSKYDEPDSVQHRKILGLRGSGVGMRDVAARDD